MQDSKRIPVSFRVTPAFKRCLELAALAERRSQTNMIEKLVFDYCRSRGIDVDVESTQTLHVSETRKI
ncbi:hypothetical protein [Burkholderia sp. BCC1993]|uniref:hypothetical protein n=1 Tax=Burkholderia sp. BCC1993 TaxID=2817444 RepID=UPI002AB038F5|nr:hypothetical protein [Burkholderia sp. BCC1993]